MDWFNLFLISGTMFFVAQLIRFVFSTYYFVRTWLELRYHDPMCEDCADELMAETIKNIRNRDEDAN